MNYCFNYHDLPLSRYLERELESMTDPYDLAIVTWALTKAQASGADLAFERLDLKKRVNGKLAHL